MVRLSKIQVAMAFIAGIIVLYSFQCVFYGGCPRILQRHPLTKPTQPRNRSHGSSKRPTTNNSVSYLYLVGVEGVGHHAVGPALASIAASCEHHVIYQNRALRRAVVRKESRLFQAVMRSLTHRPYKYKSIQIIEDSSIPADHVYRNSTRDEKKSYGPYNLEWLTGQIQQTEKINLKFLLLTRNFYRTVASHPELDGSFENHALVLTDFMRFIHSEYLAIERITPHLWKQASYEWFTEMKNCRKLVKSIVEFTGWKQCDVARACLLMAQHIKPERKIDANSTQILFAESLNATNILNIPFLSYDTM